VEKAQLLPLGGQFQVLPAGGTGGAGATAALLTATSSATNLTTRLAPRVTVGSV